MINRNVTINPLSAASAVTEPEIHEILDLKSGAIAKVPEFIARYRYGEFVNLRGCVKQRLNHDPLFACAECGTPAYIVASAEKNFFFRHVHEDGSCRAITRGSLSQSEINVRKYHGLRESDAHKRIKLLIERSLTADRNFHTIEQEKIWRAARDPRSYRRPDVKAAWEFGQLAFEVQLSTTFLDVVVERRSFYKEEGALLIWVLGSFENSYRRMTTDDLLFSNNSNVFVVDDETARLSEERGIFHIRCHFRQPVRDGDQITDSWREQIVSFRDLTRSVETQRAFFFDYAGEEAKLKATIEVEIEDCLRKQFFALWDVPERPYDQDELYRQQWDELSVECMRRGVKLPIKPGYDTDFTALMNAMQSMEIGEPRGWNFKRLVEVAHKIADQYPRHLFALGHAIRHFARKDLLAREDASGKWRARQDVIRERMKSYEPEYQPDELWLPALNLLFPEIGRPIQAHLNRISAELMAEIE